jgi:thiol:disulfide interchange protein DsbC
MQQRFWWGVISCLLAFNAHAAELPASAAKALQANLQHLGLGTVKLAQLEVQPGPIEDSYEVAVGTFVFQVSADGMVVYDLRFDFDANRSNQNTPDAKIARMKMLTWLDESQMVIFEPADETRHTLTVFSDVTCPFSKDFHDDIPTLQAQGIRVRYLAYPREGLDSLGAQRMREVWCDEDRPTAFTQAIKGIQPLTDLCDSPVAQQYQLGDSFGVEGTPTLVFEDGRLLTGYLEPAVLLSNLQQNHSPVE